jgi:hypothetical protein
MKQLKIEDFYCRSCKLPHSLIDGLCEFCRRGKPETVSIWKRIWRGIFG